MNLIRILVFSLIIFLFYFDQVAAQTSTGNSQEFVIDFINVRDGLISNYVTKTISDGSNLKYFATEGGISRFDGYTFKSYQPGDTYPKLLNENIETIFCDRENNIWIGTKSGGLSILDVSHDKISQYNDIFGLKAEAQLHVMSINQDAGGNLWIGTWNNGVYVVDYRAKKIVNHFPFETPILKIINDKYNNVWFVAGNELLKSAEPASALTRYRLPYFMTTLVEDRFRDKLWLVGNTQDVVHLLSFKLSDHEVVEEPVALTAKYIRSMAVDSKKRLWLGSWGDGLLISNSEVTAFNKIPTSPVGSRLDNINQSAILDIEIDKNDIAWLSTAYGGVLMLYPNKGFSLISNDVSESDNDDNAISIYKSSDNKLFVGTIMEGLVMKEGEKKFIPVASVPKSRVNIIEEKGAFLFLGTNRGLVVIKNRDFKNPLIRFENEKVTSILLDQKNNLWIGTQQKGLKVTNLSTDPLLEHTIQYAESGKGRYYIENNRINKIVDDESGDIWVATYSGLNKFDAASQSFIAHRDLIAKKLPTVIINDFYKKGNHFYLGTPIGFIELTYEGGKLRTQEIYDKRNGLVNDFVCALKEDRSGNLWMSSTTTITRFDPFKKTFLNYDRQDGVMVNSFHIGSSFVDEQGLVYFGGSNGVLRFNPDSLKENIKPPHIVFTGLIVNNKNLGVGDQVEDRVLLNNDINYTDRLDLGYKQNHITLTFAANDFFGTNNIFYQYKRSGNKSEWINIRRRNEINFTGLSPGDYEIQIRASRDRQNWGEVRSIRLNVDTPPWASWYAFVIYSLIVLGIGFLINYISARQAKLEAKLRIAEIEKEKEHDLNEAKLSFFTNISHEFRTPLTLILSPTTEILSSPKMESGFREKMMLIESNAKRLLNLINQLLDFRKSEHGLLTLIAERSDFISFAHEVALSFKDISHSKGIDYKFESEVDRVLLPFDRDKMEIVLCNIISNAFKYSTTGGEIRVRIYLSEKYMNLEVLDNGIGLSPLDATKVFDRFYQVQGSQTAKMVGSGIGLAFTKNIIDLHHGNIFVRSIPKKETCFTVQLLLENAYLKTQSTSLREEKEANGFTVNDYASNIDPHWVNQDSLEIDVAYNKETVLVVDDNEDIRKYLQGFLKDDYRVIEADNGVSGLAMAKQQLPDIIVSDIMMPEMDGITLCNEIKSQMITSHIPIILLTARTSIVYEVSGLERGADDYVTKPFNPVIMKARIHNILENRRKLRSYFLNRVRFEPDKNNAKDLSNLDEAFVEKAMKLVGDNLTRESFGVETLVNELCMSQSTLYRKIKSLTGLSITGFIRSVRLKKAAQMILNEDVKLNQVSFEVGFNDYKHFRVSFMEQFGCLPSEYKEKMISNINKLEENI